MQQILTAEPLRVEEFWPKIKYDCVEKKARYCKFENLSGPLERGNEWLAKHPAFQVLNVETAEKKVTYPNEVPRDLMYFPASNKSSVYMRGLRIWLTKGGHGNAQGFGDTHRLSFRDVLPEQVNGLRYETLTLTLEKYNSQSTDSPLPGQLLTIETVALTLPPRVLRADGSGKVDPLHCRYTDVYRRHRAHFFRLWYVSGDPCPCEIGITDFNPKGYKGIRRETMMPVYAPFDTLYPVVDQWMKENRDLHVVNIQTLDTRYGEDKEFGTSRLDTSTSVDLRIEQRPRVYFLRVAWARPRGEVVLPGTPTGLVGYTFRPNITADKSGFSKELLVKTEGLIRTVGRISARLEAMAAQDPSSSGSIISSVARPLWAQTLVYPQKVLEDATSLPLNQVSTSCGDWLENNDYSDTEGNKISLLYVVRVYMGSQFPDLKKDHFDQPFVREKKRCQVM